MKKKGPMSPPAGMEARSKFITFEGTEGSGKTTQAEMLFKYLRSKRRDVVMVREPGGTVVGDKIREILLDPRYGDIEPIAEALLFAADRTQQLKEVVRPALARGSIVIGDRYVDSSMAYQGVGRQCGLEAVKNLNDWATDNLEPDLTILLDLTVEEGLKRAREGHSDRIERESIEFHRNVWHAYEMLRRLQSHRIVVVDAAGSRQTVQRRVVKEVDRII